MIKEILLKLGIDTSGAKGSLKDVSDEVDKVKEGLDDTEKGVEKVKKNTNNATESIAKGFKGVGLAMKAMGVGLVIEAFNLIKDLFMSNQIIADKFGAAFKTLSKMFNDFFNFIIDNSANIKEFFTAIFENPVESIKEFGVALQENLLERLYSVIDAIGSVGTAFEKVFIGDFAGAADAIKDVGKEMIDVLTGVDNSTDAIGVLVDKSLEYVSATYKVAEALQKQENNAKRAAAIQAGLVEEYDRQAEVLRQTRDDESISIEERIKANNELGKVLKNQQTAMLVQANLQVKAAQNQYNLNKSLENEIALIEARNNVKAVEAQVTGFVSEQKVNENALNKEAIALAKSRTDAEIELATNQKNFENEREKDTLKRLERQKQLLEEQKNIELAQLQSNIQLYKEGTQARVDAENEFALRKQEIENQIILSDEEIFNYKFNKEIENNKLILENQATSFEQKYQTLLNQENLITQATNISEEERTKLLKENADARVEIAKNENDAKIALLDAYSSILNTAADLAGKDTAAGKALAVASATISTYTAIAKNLAAFAGVPIPGYAIAQAVATGVAGFAAIKNILAVKVPNSGGGGSVSTPNMSLPTTRPSSGFTTLGNENPLRTTNEGGMVKVFVTESDITNSQNKVSSIQAKATIG